MNCRRKLVEVWCSKGRPQALFSEVRCKCSGTGGFEVVFFL